MTRAELTYDIMVDRGWKSIPKMRNIDIVIPLEDVVNNIKDYTYKFLRCEKSNETYTSDEYDMISHYEVYFKKEYLEVSNDNENWTKVAYRMVKIGDRCVYTDF